MTDHMRTPSPAVGHITGHTPLPWAISDHAGNPARGWIKSICKGFPQKIVAQAMGQETLAEREANTALIVRAVNNHEALVKALEDARLQLEYVQEKHGYATGEAVLARVHAALSAAKGEA